VISLQKQNKADKRPEVRQNTAYTQEPLPLQPPLLTHKEFTVSDE